MEAPNNERTVKMIFGKSKNEILKSTQSEVFDIMRVGANISRLRKAAGITQTELADRLNVSFQAVSNWERGQSCPDIANLMELASIFGVSVDRILGSERAAKLVTEISEEKAPEMSAEEIKEIAPILDEAQADSVVRKNLMGEADTTEEEAADSGEEYESLSSVPAALLPFLSNELISELAVDAFKKDGIDAIPPSWLPFIDYEVLGEIAAEIMDKEGINALPPSWLPFIDKDVLSDMADDVCEKNGIGALPPSWLPYIDAERLGARAKALIEKSGKDALPPSWLPFIDYEVLGEIAREIMENEGIKAIPSSWLPFIDDDVLSDYIRKRLKKK